MELSDCKKMLENDRTGETLHHVLKYAKISDKNLNKLSIDFSSRLIEEFKTDLTNPNIKRFVDNTLFLAHLPESRSWWSSNASHVAWGCREAFRQFCSKEIGDPLRKEELEYQINKVLEVLENEISRS